MPFFTGQQMQASPTIGIGGIGGGTYTRYTFGDPDKPKTPSGSGGVPVAREVAPNVSQFNYSQEAQNYPTYMRNLGEQMAQRQFQTSTNQGISMGNAVGGYRRALADRNMARLQSMGMAGQEQLKAEGAQAQQQNFYQDLLAKIYGLGIAQRGDDLGYLSSLNKSSGGGPSINMGGRGSGGSSGGQGTYQGIMGNARPLRLGEKYNRSTNSYF